MFQDGLQASRLGASVPRTACLTFLGLLKTLVRPLEHGFRRLHEVHGASEYVRPREGVLAVVTKAVTAHGPPRQSCEVAAAQALRPFGRPLFKDDARAVFEVGEVAHRHRKCGHLASFLFRLRGSTSLELRVWNEKLVHLFIHAKALYMTNYAKIRRCSRRRDRMMVPKMADGKE